MSETVASANAIFSTQLSSDLQVLWELPVPEQRNLQATSLNGQASQGETVADLGGVKSSFRVYKQLVKVKGEQPTLPGLGLTPDQIFFLAYAQAFCRKYITEGLKWAIKLSSHPVPEYRIIGALQNTKEFAEAFKCPIGSYMNPADKCEVW